MFRLRKVNCFLSGTLDGAEEAPVPTVRCAVVELDVVGLAVVVNDLDLADGRPFPGEKILDQDLVSNSEVGEWASAFVGVAAGLVLRAGGDGQEDARVKLGGGESRQARPEGPSEEGLGGAVAIFSWACCATLGGRPRRSLLRQRTSRVGISMTSLHFQPARWRKDSPGSWFGE